MKIQQVTLSGFRCFGDKPATIVLSHEITALVGANGSGKSAFLEALVRMFGPTRDQRLLHRGDFFTHIITPGTRISSQKLWIDVRLGFPELLDGTAKSDAIAPTFSHMILDDENGTPICRIRMEAEWIDDGTLDGDIQQRLYWIRSLANEPGDDEKIPMQPLERSLVQVVYFPAVRGASSQLNIAIRAMLGRLLEAAQWSEQGRQTVESSSFTIRSTFESEPAIALLIGALKVRWGELHDSRVDATPGFNLVRMQYDDLVRDLRVIFRPTELGGEREIEALSEGQKSLLYFSLVAMVFDIERKILEEDRSPKGAPGTWSFNVDQLQPPSLTVFAIEEPENHLSPHYLARIIGQIRSIVQPQTGQAVITSHSPAMLGRINPEEVRHFRLDPSDGTTSVRPITLPDSPAEAAKYVREAVVAYPELYFARIVVLCEGDSEQIILPSLASAMNLDVDRSFVAVVPLGGRHISHFWRLLSDLEIPYVTLLDLDLGRKGGGPGRVKYVLRNLAEVGRLSDELVKSLRARTGAKGDLVKELDKLGAIGPQHLDKLAAWLSSLEETGVFFSQPIDLDMMMIEGFKAAYTVLEKGDRGPARYDPGHTDYEPSIRKAASAVFGEADPPIDSYTVGELAAMPDLFWYRYLFSTKSKPASHILALSRISKAELAQYGPSVLKRLLERVQIMLRS